MTQSDIINNNFSKAFECIKCSNAYGTGEVLSEEKLFKQISERRHSTFDLSKFTVVGSPNITEAGVASGLTKENSIQAILHNTVTINNKSFILKNKYKVGKDNSKANMLYCTANTIRTELGVNRKTLQSILPANIFKDNTNVYCAINFDNVVSVDDVFDFEMILNLENKTFTIKAKKDGKNYEASKTIDLRDDFMIQSLNIGSFYNSTDFFWQGSIDLKQFSITVDGKEVFSGNKTGLDVINDVEIPYTLSKTGSKIVDVAYRDRVIDLYEQEGQAGYYTIDEENKNFTLPMGEIYGMIGGSSSTGGSGLEICDIGMALYVDESKGLRRYLNGQIVDINTNTQAFLNRLKEIKTTNPDYFTTEENWQAEALLNIDGCVYKFVLNYADDGETVVSVRLPKYPDYIEVSAGNTATKAPIKELGLVPKQGYGVTVGGMYWIPAKLTNVGSTDKVNASCKLLSQDGSGAVWLNEIKSGAKGNYFSGYADLSGLNIKTTKLKLRYFIQIATGSETENNIINEIELNNPYSLFDSKYSDHELNNLSWLKSEGQWNAKSVYTDAYNELLTEYNNSASVNKTEGSITFKRTPKGYKIALADQETAIDTKYTTDGIAWYYILDTTNEKFKLPRTKFGFEGLRTNVGDDIRAGLPNITGTAQTAPGRNGYVATGALNAYLTQNATEVFINAGVATGIQYGISFDASHSNSIYGNNTTVQPPATQMYLYFYVGETVQNANLIDAGRIGEQLATKASVNDIDGAFIKAPSVLVEGTTYTVGTTYDTKTLVQFDISNYLPEDSNEYDYEVRLSSEGYTITNNSVMLWINTPSVADISYGWSDQVNTSCGSVGSVVTQIIPKGYKKASIYLRSGSSSIMFYSHIVGYRRLRKGA